MTKQKKSKGSYWPWLLVGLLVASAGANIGMVITAVRDPSFAVEKDYYKKALKWDNQMAQQKQNRKLGWKIKLLATQHPKSKRAVVLQATLVNRSKQPIRGASLASLSFANARAGMRNQVVFAEKKPGVYQAVMPRLYKGLWIFRMTAKQDKHQFTQTIRLDL